MQLTIGKINELNDIAYKLGTEGKQIIKIEIYPSQFSTDINITFYIHYKPPDRTKLITTKYELEITHHNMMGNTREFYKNQIFDSNKMGFEDFKKIQQVIPEYRERTLVDYDNAKTHREIGSKKGKLKRVIRI